MLNAKSWFRCETESKVGFFLDQNLEKYTFGCVKFMPWSALRTSSSQGASSRLGPLDAAHPRITGISWDAYPMISAASVVRNPM